MPVKLGGYHINEMPFLRREGTRDSNEANAKYPHTYDWVNNVQKNWITWGGKGPHKILSELASAQLIGYDGTTVTISSKQAAALRALVARGAN